MSIASIVFHEIRQVALETGLKMVVDINSDTKVFDSGLDSLGFAVLVAKLEDSLGFDPFAAMEEPFYPETIGQFIAVYEQYVAAS